jgi:hypothetical protein
MQCLNYYGYIVLSFTSASWTFSVIMCQSLPPL